VAEHGLRHFTANEEMGLNSSAGSNPVASAKIKLRATKMETKGSIQELTPDTFATNFAEQHPDWDDAKISRAVKFVADRISYHAEK
jgi:hypothetical protein